MEMRLGKTLTCIRWLKTFSPRTILIVAPKTVLISWEKELLGEGLPFTNIADLNMKQKMAYLQKPSNGYTLINYEAISLTHPKKPKGSPLKYNGILNAFMAVVLDESTKIKNVQAKVTKIMLAAAPTIPIRACLTGLANPQGWGNIWAQCAFVAGGVWMNHKNYYEWEYVHYLEFGFEKLIRPSSEVEIRKNFQQDAFCLTRKQAGIRNEKIRIVRQGDLEPQTRTAYNSILKVWALPGEEPGENSTKYAMVVHSWLRRICGGIFPTKPPQFIDSWKYSELLGLLSDELSNQSVVVWYSFNSELANSFKLLKEAGISTTWITGECSFEDRKDRIGAFQDGSRRVILIQEMCGQFGIDLSRADTCIYFSTHYSYELRAQSEERIFAVGKPNDNLIIDFVTRDTIEEGIQENLAGKKSDAALLLARYRPHGLQTTSLLRSGA